MIVPELNTLLQKPRGRLNRNHIRTHYPEFYDFLETKYNFDTKNWSEKLWLYYNGLSEKPKCPICGKGCSFVNFSKGYSLTCSYKCSYASGEHAAKIRVTNRKTYSTGQPQQKIKQTMQERWGVDSAMQNQELKKKAQDTLMKRYGGIGNASNSIKYKQKSTMIAKYGGIARGSETINKKIEKSIGATSPFCFESIRNKAKQTCLERYGTEIALQSDEIRNKIKQTCKEKYGVELSSQIGLKEKYPDLIKMDGNVWTMKCPHPDCQYCQERQYETESSIYYDRNKSNSEQCTHLLPITPIRSTYEINLCELLNLYSIEYETGNRSVLRGKELDIYIPDKKVAIEINGCYWHSDKRKPLRYHEQKFVECRAQNIQLIQIWEDWMVRKPDIVKSIIMAKLGRFEHRTGASKCKVRPVDKKTGQQFLEANHIQGRCGASINYGLYYKGNLVSMMTFGKRRPGMGAKTAGEGQYELLRFCNLKGWQVVGGADRLLKHFIRDYQPKEIISFSSNDISDGELYRKLGFEQTGNIERSYWYIEPGTYKRYHRFSFNKYQIKKKGLAPDRPSWTEREAMDEAGYYRIYDSGTTKWMLKIVK